MNSHRESDSLSRASYEDVDGDLHRCGRCQAHYPTILSFIDHRTEHCNASGSVQQASLSAVQMCEVAGSRNTQMELQPWQPFGLDGDIPVSLAFSSHPTSTAAAAFAGPPLANAVNSSTYPAAATADESTCVPAVVVGGLGFDPASDHSPAVSKSSVSLLSVSDAPLQLLVEMPPAPPVPAGRQPPPGPFLVESGDSMTVADLAQEQTPADAPPVKPPPKKRLRQKKHVCEICGHRCSYPKDLKRHKFKHLNEKFACTQCDAIYNRPDKLADHVRVTHREPAARRRVACPVDGCQYRAVDNHHVQKHMRDRHSDERPHSCQVCSYSAKHQHQLTIHLRSHTGDCPFVCPEEECGKAFRTSSDLRRHQLSHSGEHPFTCDLCSFASAFKGNFYKHLRRIHGVDRNGEKIAEENAQPLTDQPAAVSAAGRGAVRRGGGRGRRRPRGTYPANFWCDLCHASFVREEAYVVHRGTHGLEGPPPHPPPPPAAPSEVVTESPQAAARPAAEEAAAPAEPSPDDT